MQVKIFLPGEVKKNPASGSLFPRFLVSMFLRRQIPAVSVVQPTAGFPEPEGNATHHHQLTSQKLALFQVDDADAGLNDSLTLFLITIFQVRQFGG
jgi:hypothetical protein